MAFQSALDALSSSIHKDAVLNPVLNHSVRPLQDSLVQFPWILQKEHLPFLIATGIPASGYGTTPHPHAVHKVIETHLLFHHWSHLASTLSSVMFMKPSKFRKLARLNPSFVELINFRLTAADSVRYPETSTSLPSQPTVFMHDALMYFHPFQILDLFIRCPNLQRLHCSLVVPPESSFTDLSFYPTVYTYSISGNSLHYVPENHHAGSYNQPLSAIQWLKISSINSPLLNLSVTTLDSWGPCHSILIQRGLPIMHSSALPMASFTIPRCLALPEATFLHQPLRHRLVPTEVYDALFTYTRAVRTLRVSDPAGFVRTHSNKPQYAWVTSQAWDNLHTYALLNSSIRPRVVFDFFLSPAQKLNLFLAQHLHPFVIRALPFLAPLPFLASHLLRKLPIPTPKSVTLFHRRFPKRPHAFNLDHCPPLLRKPAESLCTVLSPHLHPQLLSLLQSWGLCHAPEAIFSLVLQPRRLPLLPKPLLLLTSLLFPAASAMLKFLSPQSLQSLHDGYNAHLHPSDFNLSWKLEAFQSPCPASFLPFEFQTPPPEESVPMVQAPFPEVPAPQVAPPISASTPQLAPSPTPPPNLSVTPEPPQVPNPTPALADPAPELQVPSSFLFPELTPDSTSIKHDLPPLPELPLEMPVHQRSVNEFGSLNSNLLPVPSTMLNASAGKQPLPAGDLISDSSCSGPVVEFEVLLPANYHNSNGCFPTRLRAQPKSSIPLPVKNCLLQSVAAQVPYDIHSLWGFLCEMLPDSLLDNEEITTFGLSTDHLTALAYRLHFECVIHAGSSTIMYGIKGASTVLHITFSDGPPKHFAPYVKLSASAPGSNPSKSPLVRAALRFQFNGNFLPFQEAHSHSISVQHAKNLISNMKNGFDGITSQLSGLGGKSPRTKLLELDAQIDVAFSRNVDLIHIAGFAGCGKSHPIQKLLKTRAFHHFRLAVPTNELRAEWKRDLDLPDHESWRLCTWETALFKTSNVLVIDEIYKLPRGYLDLILLSDPSIQLVIILGDPLQGEYHSSHPSSSNSMLPSETLRLSAYIDCYCWWTYRCPKVIADLFGVRTYSQTEGKIVSSVTHPQNLPNLVNSIATATTMQNLGHHALTISSSQGMTFDSMNTILLDRHSTLLSAQNCLVALTRSRSGVIFIGNMYQASGHFGTSYIFTQALSGIPVDMVSAFPMYHKLRLLHEPIKSRRHRLVAGDQSLSSSRLASLLARSAKLPPHIPVTYDRDVVSFSKVVHSTSPEVRLSTMHLPPTRLPLHSDLESCAPSSSVSASISIAPTPISHSFAGESFEELAAFFLPAHDPSLKEIMVSDQASNQFPFMDQPFVLSCQPSSLIAASHKPSSDPTLLIASIQKRLRFRPSSSPYAFTANDHILGRILFDSWCRAFNRSPSIQIPFNPALFAECVCLNEYAQLSSKTQATIVANASRSDPDWRYTAVRIFAKSQHKVNDGSIFGSWKACQTLALMHDFVILALGPVKKYQRIIDHADRPGFIYSHCGKTPSQLASWSQSFLSGSEFICNDYTSFDQSQHGEAVIFEVLKMHRVSIPMNLIALHVYLKTNVSTQFGPLTCMRLTGEPGTYDDNTDYNLAVIYSQYDILSHPIMVSGDDSVICGLPPIRSSWPQVRELLHLRFKTEFTSRPLFCGYYVGSAGACRNPFALFAKLMISYDKGNLLETLPSYLFEFSIGHRLGDIVSSLFPPHLLSYYSACFDLFCRRCPPAQKVILSFDPVPESFFASLARNSRWVSKALFSDLPEKIRALILSKSSMPSYHFDPKVQYLESELLLSFNHGGNQTNQSQTTFHTSPWHAPSSQ
ncbi:polyprotein [Plantago mottle virus]|uniref:Non-structural replication polyprotein n=1 Tax=Plantago mottle virus TaxID=312274 RepID=Q3BD96_9VIRU|nr:polyprotein [Plantago mottle virus]AAW88526.1 polyprotein [Plantago mottle virus]